MKQTGGQIVKPAVSGAGMTCACPIISEFNIKVDTMDTGCCALDCPYKQDKHCTLYNKELIGTFENPTRCPQCNDYK